MLVLGGLVAAPSASAAGQLGAAFGTTGTWDSGFGGQYTIRNTGDAPVNGWSLVFDLPANVKVTSLWNGTHSVAGNRNTVQALDWNRVIPVGQSVTVGFNGSFTGSFAPPTACTVNGADCAGGGGDQSAPSVPGGLRVTGAASSSLSLSWTAATDNVGVTGYRVYEGNQVVATSTGTSVSVTGLAAGSTHTYAVTALDAAGNESGRSQSVTGTTEPGTSEPSPNIVGAYYANWTGFPVAQIPAQKLTHLFYAFGSAQGGRCQAPSGQAVQHFAELKSLQQRFPHLKVIISVGGWGADGFSDGALTDASRKAFAASCVDLYLKQYKDTFDGIDIDWEFPVSGGIITKRPEDKRNATLLFQELRKQIDAVGVEQGRKLELMAATPVGRFQDDGPYDVAQSFELGEIAKILDFINVMTYDMGTGYSPISMFNAPMRAAAEDPTAQPMKGGNNVVGGIEHYLANGVPKNKMVLGTPFYSRGFNVNSPEADAKKGLFLPYSSTLSAPQWKTLKAQYLTNPAWQQLRHTTAQVPYLYNSSTKQLISYEDPQSIAVKAAYAKQTGLRGTFMWELSDDDAQWSLLEAMRGPFGS
ncbi:GH18 family chitinase [Crossiella equi]|uniref:chitinase n=1 Tax=Crossiella equi TaxID=130796 RepID=A0ABS5AEC6_9PSEU|nr:glycoside hydrolase family 18 chitinase [Crossiella equi]MBP2474930.1 GH18 family chitinase [Crossiella equi]